MKILVPLDGSAFGEAVLPYVASLASRCQAEVTLLRVLDPAEVISTPVAPGPTSPHDLPEYELAEVVPGLPTPGPVLAETRSQAIERAREAATNYLNNVARRLFPEGAYTRVLFGEEIAQTLVEYARQQRMDFIAMATHGRTGLAKLLMGSVAAEVLQARVTPLLLMRPDHLGPPAAEATTVEAQAR